MSISDFTKKFFHPKLGPLILHLSMPLSAAAGEVPYQLGTITVEAPLEKPSWINPDRSTTTYEVGKAGVTLFSGPGSTNPYMAVSQLPSVNAPSVDPYGMANIPGGNKGLRVRGELSTHGSAGSVEGIPLTGINPGPSSQWLFDMENVSAVSLSEGPIAPDKEAFFTTSGVLDTRLVWPDEKFGIQASQSMGSFNFRRSFVRLDSGRLANDVFLFLSASSTRANKWKGPGSSPDGRSNFEAGIVKNFSGDLEAKVYFAYNDMKENNYRPLSYAQAGNLDAYRNFDYSSSSSATPASAVNYYDYNKQSFRNWTLFSELSYRLDERSRITVKPYYLKETGNYLDGMANGKVRQWLIDHDWYGLTAEFQTRISGTGLKLGYWWESSNPPGPPTAWKMYNPTAAGGLAGASWAILSDATRRHEFSSLHALAERKFGGIELQAGARYVKETLPGFNFYNPAGIGDVSYSQALASSSGVVANRSAGSFSLSELLPFVAMNYTFTPGVELKGSIGRNYGAPGFDVWPVFQQNSATFLAKGLTADALWHTIKPETSNAIDLGLRLDYPKGYFEPTLFYARNHNKSVSYDPGVGVAYSQNIGETHAYGLQGAGGWSPRKDLDLFGSISYNRNVFDRNLPMLNGTSLAVQGLQLPDTPQWQASIGAAGHIDALTVSPVLHYSGSRYGDTQNTQAISAYATLDLNLDYRRKLSAGMFDASLSFINLFDKQYIGFVNASYYQLLSNSNAIYYPGTPRTIVGKVSVDF